VPVPGLNDLNETIKLLLERIPANPGTFSVELVMPHAAAFESTLATQVSALNSPFTLKATVRDNSFSKFGPGWFFASPTHNENVMNHNNLLPAAE
jgi:hypothetical protein